MRPSRSKHERERQKQRAPAREPCDEACLRPVGKYLQADGEEHAPRAGDGEAARAPVVENAGEEARDEDGERGDAEKVPALLEHEAVVHVRFDPDGEDREGEDRRDQPGERGVAQGPLHARRAFGGGDRGAVPHDQTFSTSGRPSSPEGMKIRTTMRIEKAAAFL